MTLKLGYREIGDRRVTVRDRPVRERLFALTPEQWSRHDHPPTEIEGLDACRELFG